MEQLTHGGQVVISETFVPGGNNFKGVHIEHDLPPLENSGGGGGGGGGGAKTDLVDSQITLVEDRF